MPATIDVPRTPVECWPDWSTLMQGTAKKEWTQLCEQAAVEQDPEKLMLLVSEINRMLDEKEERLKGHHSQTPVRERER